MATFSVPASRSESTHCARNFLWRSESSHRLQHCVPSGSFSSTPPTRYTLMWINLCVSATGWDCPSRHRLTSSRRGGKQSKNPATNSTSWSMPTGRLCSRCAADWVGVRLCITDPRRPVFRDFVKASKTEHRRGFRPRDYGFPQTRRVAGVIRHGLWRPGQPRFPAPSTAGSHDQD
jgi:hypothetical protein